MQDLLAMTALQLATKPKAQAKAVPVEPDYSGVESELERLSNDLEGLQ